MSHVVTMICDVELILKAPYDQQFHQHADSLCTAHRHWLGADRVHGPWLVLAIHLPLHLLKG